MSSLLRKEGTHDSKEIPRSDRSVMRLTLKALRRRKTLIHGRLHEGNRSCAMGTFWKDNPDVTINTELLDEIATINDSVPKATQQERWATVVAWLEWKLNTLKFR